MPLVIFVLALFVGKVIFDFYLEIHIDEGKRALEAIIFYCDLSSKIREMLDNSRTTRADWIALLPVCQYSDTFFLTTHPYIEKETYGGNTWAVQQILEGV